MNYHNITKEDMLNGDGLRVVLWVAGCSHSCRGCHNPITWAVDGGVPFDQGAKAEIFEQLAQPYVAGLTLSGGDPLHLANRKEVAQLIETLKKTYPQKTIWLYTGFLWEDIKDLDLVSKLDVLVDGGFVEALKDHTLHWRGSSNQLVIDVQKTLATGKKVLWDS